MSPRFLLPAVFGVVLLAGPALAQPVAPPAPPTLWDQMRDFMGLPGPAQANAPPPDLGYGAMVDRLVQQGQGTTGFAPRGMITPGARAVRPVTDPLTPLPSATPCAPSAPRWQRPRPRRRRSWPRPVACGARPFSRVRSPCPHSPRPSSAWAPQLSRARCVGTSRPARPHARPSRCCSASCRSSPTGTWRRALSR